MTERTKHRILSLVKRLIRYNEPIPYQNMSTTEIKPIILKDIIQHNIPFDISLEEYNILYNSFIEESKLKLCRGMKEYISRVDNKGGRFDYTELTLEFYIKPKD